MGTLTFQATLGGSVNLLGPNTAATVNLTLPSADGTSGQALQTNGSGTLSFATLGIGGGGTGLTSFTANQIHYGSFSQSAGLTFDGTNFATTGTATATKLIPTGTSVTGNGMYLPAANSVGISTAGTNAVYIDASQNVGVGITPSAWSAIKPIQVGYAALGAFSANLYATVNTFFNGTDWKYITTDFACRYQQSSGQHQWYTAPSGTAGATASFTQTMTLDNSGNVGIGTSSPSSYGKLAVISNGAADTVMLRQNGAVGATAQTAIAFQNAASSYVGSITCNGTVTSYNTSSDYRLKNTIASMTGALDKVALLKPCTYKWSLDGSDGQGFIAHELAEVCPHAVTGEKDAVDADGKPQYQGIDVSFLVATLTAAIQELNAKFEEYKAAHP